MISIIICSRQSNILQALQDNINDTIGLDYELVVIDNSSNQYTIFQAYNEGVKRSKYPYLCFMHDDILYHTQGWGINVINHFQSDHKIGLIGIVGTHYLPDNPSYWCYSGVLSGHLIQGMIENGVYKTENVSHMNYVGNNDSIGAVAVDGLWFCMPKFMFSFLSFDEKTFKGFHCYDMDICLQTIKHNYNVEIVMDILIEHSSYGSETANLNKSLKVCFKKWKKLLPLVVGVQMTESEKDEIKKRISRFTKKKKQTNFFKALPIYSIYSRYIKSSRNK